MTYNPTKPYKKSILKLIQKTWDTPHVSVKKGIYPVFKKKFNYFEVDHTDGIGTKGIYHWQKGTFKAAVMDALAMNLNDLATVGGVPYKLSNHVTVPIEDIRILQIIRELVFECRKRKIAIVGGENSFHNNLSGLDISMTISGFLKKPRPNKFKSGDVLIGIKSNGLHSNGFTKVREIFGNQYRPEFTQPTAIYLDTISKLSKKYKINGMIHITGGAFTKLNELLKGCDAYITRNHKLKPQNIFMELYKRGLSDKEMYRTFNCGIGFIFSVMPGDAKEIVKKSRDMDIIGKVVLGTGKVKINSLFSRKLLTF